MRYHVISAEGNVEICHVPKTHVRTRSCRYTVNFEIFIGLLWFFKADGNKAHLRRCGGSLASSVHSRSPVIRLLTRETRATTFRAVEENDENRGVSREPRLLCLLHRFRHAIDPRGLIRRILIASPYFCQAANRLVCPRFTVESCWYHPVIAILPLVWDGSLANEGLRDRQSGFSQRVSTARVLRGNREFAPS